ncbi:MAG TPA: di-heme oxidoredictase family protein [Candidatus Angelobacter sp.]|nr:di-heme oxidoredictase family protein [Candidatus Angelobacter sp.]
MHRLRPIAAGIAFCLALSIGAFAQRDPGVRGGLKNVGGGLQEQGIPIPHPPLISPNPNHPDLVVSQNEASLFFEGVKRMAQLESTCDTCSVAPFGVGDGNPVGPPFVPAGTEIDPDFPQTHTNSNGLGTRHNADNCFECHAQPTLGGSGGFIAAHKGDVAQNPQFDLVPHRFGRKNVVPAFELQFGPIREARFKFNPDGTRDGGVHALWTILGDIEDIPNPNCDAVQPDFAHELANNNVSFRIPLQLLGLGLIESIEDREILAHQAATAQQRAALGIGGHPNRSDNDGTINRFGWKAQNKSLAIFAGEAYNVEMGVSNDVFPNARDENPNCAKGKPAPNDINRVDPTDAENHAFNNPLHELPDWQEFAITMRFTDGPQPAANPSQSAQRGRQVFSQIGCVLCHTATMQTGGANGIGGPFNSPVLVDRPVNLFSDLLLHHMGPGLADDIVQGAAGPDEFRSTPLWGVGQRIFFLHDGRTSDLLQAILFHESGDSGGYSQFGPSEANGVIRNFRALNSNDQQAVLDFLRSL